MSLSLVERDGPPTDIRHRPRTLRQRRGRLVDGTLELRLRIERLVPWAIPSRPTAVPFTEQHGLALVGGFGLRPNVDAALWLADTVMPALAAESGGIARWLKGAS